MPIPKIYYENKFKYGDSVFKGETWKAFRPGEDIRFKSNWVARDTRGNAATCVNTREELVENAKMLGVKLKWKRKSNTPLKASPERL